MKISIKLSLLVAGLMLFFCPAVFSAQFDAPFYDFAKKNEAVWAKEDQQINAKLAALEKKFGKKPNIIYILADDVGWGELGWQGGGKHRGTPTPELDKMAHDAIRCGPACCPCFGPDRRRASRPRR